MLPQQIDINVGFPLDKVVSDANYARAMLNLRCFGALTISADRTVGTSSGQARRLSVLVVLAANAERGTSRDALLALLWPVSDESRGRPALSQALYALRRDLGADDLILGQRELRLNPSVIASDVERFSQLLASGEDEAAVGLYEGDFLDGVHIAHAEAFERWVDDRRVRYARLHREALERLAGARHSAGDHVAAIGWWHRAADADPLSDRIAAQLARAYAAEGDRASAVRHLLLHEARLRDELDVGPDADLIALRAEFQRPAQRLAAVPIPEVPGAAVNRGALSTTHEHTGTAPATDKHGARARRWVVSAVVLLSLAATVMLSRSRALAITASPEIASAPRRLLVQPFEFIGVAGEEFKARAVERLLTANLASLPLLYVQSAAAGDGVPSAALSQDSAGATRGVRYTLFGSVVSTPGQARISATLALRTGAGDSVVRFRASSERGDLSALADDLARLLLGQLGEASASKEILAAASGTTRSLEALQAFVSGEEQFAAGHWKAAQDAFGRAVQFDTAFALAHYRFSEAANWNGDGDTQAASAKRAWELRRGLPLRERMLIEAYYAWNSGLGEVAESKYRDATARYPGDIEAWYQLGEVLFHSGPVFGRPMQRAIGPYERVESLAIGPRNTRRIESLLHLARIAGASGELARFDSLLRVLRPLAASTDLLELNTLAACVGQRATDVALMERELATASGLTLTVNAQRCAVYGSALVRATSIYNAARRSEVDAVIRVSATIEAAALFSAMGDRTRAMIMLGAELTGRDAAALLLHRGLTAWQDPSASIATLRAIRDSLDAGYPRAAPVGIGAAASTFGLVNTRFAPYVAGLLSVRLGDTARIAQQVQRLRRIGADSGIRVTAQNLAHSLLAHRDLDEGRPTGALAHLDSLAPVPVVPRLEYALFRAPERLLRARALLALGRADEAAAVAQSVGQRSAFEYTLVPAAARVAIRALEASGRSDSARVLAARYRAKGIVIN